MNETLVVDTIIKNGFACTVTAWLLWERYKFNTDIIKTLEKVSSTMDIISDRIERLK